MEHKPHLQNVLFNEDLKPWTPLPDAIYSIHIEEVLGKVREILGEAYDDYVFLYYEHRMRRDFKCLGMSGGNVILIMMADEKSTVPDDICDHYFAVIKPFYPLEKNTRNIIAFPVGYSNSSAMTRFIPFSERKYDASYAGNFLANRLDFYRSFNFLKWLPPFTINHPKLRLAYFLLLKKLRLFRPVTYLDRYGRSICHFTGGFTKGLSREEYADIISNTRIALCPKGFLTTECFRLMETMRLGCVIISDELPPSRWYKDSPIIVVKDWLHIDRVVSDLLNDPERMEKIHRETLAWWDSVCSDEAVAKYLADEILRIRQSTNEQR